LPLLTLVTAVLAILGLVPLMNNFAHIAGFVAGFLACLIALLNRRVSLLLVLACTASKRGFAACLPLQNSVKHCWAECLSFVPCLVSKSGSNLHAHMSLL